MTVVAVTLAGGTAEVHYTVTGSGPGLLLLHGTAATHEQWAPVVALAREAFTVVAPDFSGSGGTVDHGGPVSIADLAAEALAAADAAGLTTFHVAGHSLGAVVAAHLAGTHPARVRSAVLHAAWPKTDARQDAEFRYWLALLERGTDVFARMLPLMAFGPGYWAATTPEANEDLVAQLVIQPGTARQIEADRGVDLRPVLGAITAPTLVLSSAYDRLIEPAQQQELLTAIPHANHVELPAGHGAPAEVAAEFAKVLVDFAVQAEADRLEP
ncbi:alpha/beta hydrolase [Amycolatopsis rhabdoformis]|uniref:Alpha/beta hydrolase n=1 Tax=Amycolatopsis rhabdoformis TaxID=1448059 RepID=A0ABZ1IMQ8_9PSEU|nr:alpha/beta hydrolase [Amycolatopsis rhabdoformis]WSE34928.1 alpha/beta hydrolase [Amycolatopsis rhabdoformis]